MENENKNEKNLLDNIKSPDDVKAIGEEELPKLCSQIRETLVSRVCENGGHLASNLGVVELTVALHRVFSSPRDHIIFDVGHQSYVHKLLTGRADKFDTLRLPGGLSGFTRRAESAHDAFGAGHSSTSLSAALGFAEADRLNGSDAYSIAVVGDGAYTGGMIHEALNNCRRDLRLIIILNENEMSISKNIGAFASYIAKIRAGKKYYHAKRRTRNFLSKIPLIGKPLVSSLRKIKKRWKDRLFGSNYFEEMGIYYLGPVEGDDLMAITRLLEEAKAYNGCCVVHVKTKKGAGYKPAEEDPNAYHGVLPNGKTLPDSFSREAGTLLCEYAERDNDICAVTAAMASGTGLDLFRERFPERFFDVGIAEQHAVTFCAGLSAGGKKPVFAVYSTFLQRAFDNVIHDVALQKLPVKFLIDRAGLAASDGPTHHGIYDVSFLSGIPGVEVFSPFDYLGLRRCCEAAFASDLISFVRYPSGSENKELSGSLGQVEGSTFLRALEQKPCENVIITYGRIAEEAIKAKESQDVSVNVIVTEKLFPERETIDAIVSSGLIAKGKGKIIFLEEGMKRGGVGEILREALRELFPEKKMSILAIEDGFVFPEKDENIRKAYGICADDIIKALNE